MTQKQRDILYGTRLMVLRIAVPKPPIGDTVDWIVPLDHELDPYLVKTGR